MEQTKDIEEQWNSTAYFFSRMSYTGVQFVHAPYTLVEGLSVQGRNREEYIVAQWFKESDEFKCEFPSNHQPSPPNNTSEVTPYVHSKVYNPFKAESSLFSIIKMNPLDIDETIAFYNEYGPLNQTSSRYDVSSFAGNLLMDGIMESRKFFIKSVVEIQTVVKGFYNLEDVREGKTFTDKEQLEFLEHYDPGYWKPRWEHVDIPFEDLLQAMLFKIINVNLKPISPYAEVFEDGNFYPGYSTENLLGAIWFILYNILTKMPGRQVFKKCLYCYDQFLATSANQKFCPDYSAVRADHSPCENSHNQMVFQARKWFRNGEKSIQEIADHYRRAIDEVEGWMTKKRKITARKTEP
jgi:hypothetical protein